MKITCNNTVNSERVLAGIDLKFGCKIRLPMSRTRPFCKRSVREVYVACTSGSSNLICNAASAITTPSYSIKGSPTISAVWCAKFYGLNSLV